MSFLFRSTFRLSCQFERNVFFPLQFSSRVKKIVVFLKFEKKVNTVKLGYNDHGYHGYNEQNEPFGLIQLKVPFKFHAYNEQKLSKSRL
jgi:hypothetical protein